MINYLVEAKIYPVLLKIFSVFSKLQICNIMLLHIDKHESKCIYLILFYGFFQHMYISNFMLQHGHD